MAKYQKVKRNKNIYSSRRRCPTWLRILLFLVIMVAVGFFGGKLLLDAWNDAKRNYQSSTLESSSSDSSQEISSSSQESVDSEPESSQAPETNNQVNGVMMPRDILLDATKQPAYFQQLKQQGQTAVIVNLKDDHGTIYYQSENLMANTYDAIVENAVDLSVLCQDIIDAGLTPIARIHTLKDAVVSRVAEDTTYLYYGQSGTAWLDNAKNAGGKTWLNPYKQNTKSYIAHLTAEITSAGFKRVILASLEYPGKDSAVMGIANESLSRLEALAALYTQAKSEAERNQATVAIEMSAEVFFGVNDANYNGNPALIGADELAVIFDANILKQNETIPVLQNNLTGDFAGAIRVMKQDLEVDGTKVIPVFLSTQAEQYNSYLQQASGDLDYYVID